MIEPNFRLFTAADAEAVSALALEAWRHTYRTIFDVAFIENFVKTNYASERLISLVPLVESGEMFFHVAQREAQLVGFCNIGMADQKAQLYRIYLLPACIGQVIGRKLLQLGEAFIASKGIHSYTCFVHGDNELGKAFYLRNGFHHLEAFDHDGEWCMEKSLV
jgi:ribosomal protein S18 acetylase RimI-like enzyme